MKAEICGTNIVCTRPVKNFLRYRSVEELLLLNVTRVSRNGSLSSAPNSAVKIMS